MIGRRLAARYAEEFRRAAIEAGTGDYAHPGWARLFWRIHRTLRRLASATGTEKAGDGTE